VAVEKDGTLRRNTGKLFSGRRRRRSRTV